MPYGITPLGSPVLRNRGLGARIVRWVGEYQSRAEVEGQMIALQVQPASIPTNTCVHPVGSKA